MMTAGERLRATYEFKPTDHLLRKEFYIWSEALAAWKGQGLPDDWEARNFFQFDEPATIGAAARLGWCEPPFIPDYEEKVIADEGETEIIQDFAGRWLRCFKGRRHGFMPAYIRHPVTSMEDWERDVAPRLNPDDPTRYAKLDQTTKEAAALRDKDGRMVTQGFIGGYMYLRALMGPEELLYAFVEQPELIRALMDRWFQFVDRGLDEIQRRIELDEISMGEDICYNQGLLISPKMVREFLLPHYKRVVERARARQRRRLYFMVDTDGWAGPAIPLYLEAGMDGMMPFEVASKCDVVELGRQYPRLMMLGGIDKRVLAEGPGAIDRHLDYILPAMVKRGGFIPTCDHGVPDNVSLGNYLHYRRRICELDSAR